MATGNLLVADETARREAAEAALRESQEHRMQLSADLGRERDRNAWFEKELTIARTHAGNMQRKLAELRARSRKGTKRTRKA